jgi:hypothetical protein
LRHWQQQQQQQQQAHPLLLLLLLLLQELPLLVLRLCLARLHISLPAACLILQGRNPPGSLPPLLLLLLG